MPPRTLPELAPERALLFRITHRENLPWILDHGLHCRHSDRTDARFVTIGNVDLIAKRDRWPVPVSPGGTLGDYIPFYFTPLSVMAFNICTGQGDVRRRDGKDIVILVTSLPKLQSDGVSFLFTDRHAALVGTRFSADLSHLTRIDWTILRNRDFSRDNDDLGKKERYQAEALVHRSLPTNSLIGIACYDRQQTVWAAECVAARKLPIPVITRRSWYFP